MKFVSRAFFSTLLVFSVLFVLLLPSFSVVSAQQDMNIRASLMVNSTIIPFNYDAYPGVNRSNLIDGTGAQGVVSTVRNVINKSKQLLAPVLVFIIAGFGIQLIIAGGNEENFNTAARHFFYVLIGVGMVILADFISQTFLLYQTEGLNEPTSFLSSSENVNTAGQAIKKQIELLIVFVRYILGGVALFYVTKSGATIIFNAEEETVSKQKEVFIYGFVGLILVMVSEALVNVVFGVNTLPNLPGVALGSFFASTQVNVGGGLTLIGNVTNLLLAMMGGLFLFTLVIGGTLYAFSAGNEERGERATKIIIGSLLGLVIAFSSYTIVSTFSSEQGTVVTEPRILGPANPLPSSNTGSSNTNSPNTGSSSTGGSGLPN